MILNDEIQEGQFHDGTPHGFARTVMDNGQQNIGWHKFGLLHGYAKQILPNGDIKEGLWNLGKFVGKDKEDFDKDPPEIMEHFAIEDCFYKKFSIYK